MPRRHRDDEDFMVATSTVAGIPRFPRQPDGDEFQTDAESIIGAALYGIVVASLWVANLARSVFSRS